MSVSQAIVIKRDGRPVPFEPYRIQRAIALAFLGHDHPDQENPFRNDANKHWGLTEERLGVAHAITDHVVGHYEEAVERGDQPTVEQIGDWTEQSIAQAGYWDVAKAYVIYRTRHAETRIRSQEQNGLQEYIAIAKYARWDKSLGRRELFHESTSRVEAMHLRYFSDRLQSVLPIESVAREFNLTPSQRALLEEITTLESGIRSSFDSMRRKEVLSSMRALQFGGAAVEASHARQYNCSFTFINRPRVFGEIMYLLLCGTGVGFSVQRHHVDALPVFPVRGREDDLSVQHWNIPDTIEGWADAVIALIDSYYKNVKLEFSYAAIRPKGTPLKTSGGRAPGHLPLKRTLTQIEKVLDGVSGRKMKPIEAYDIIMFVARAVLSGGIRRSATIALFSPDDDEMASAKTGDWFATHPQRGGSNNSAMLVRSEATESDFANLFEKQMQYGEPGFYFSDSSEYGTNPCAEIGLAPYAVLTESSIQRLVELGHPGGLNPGDVVSGFQFCNLTTINGGACLTEEDFLRACVRAATIGSLQAAYVHIPYLGPVTQFLNEREALLGVSITGIMDNPELLLEPSVLEQGALMCKAANAAISAVLGTERAARITCIKPEGTASLLLNTGSGIHAHHAKRYFRRVMVNRLEPPYQHFTLYNPHMTETSVWNSQTDDVLTFPVEAPPTAILRKDISALQFLRYVKQVQKHWVQAGTNREEINPGLHHNVSNTVTFAPDEALAVRDFIWENRAYFTGVSLLNATGDKQYVQAPREEVTTLADVEKWNRLVYTPIDWTTMLEASDQTSLKDIIACAGGACELP